MKNNKKGISLIVLVITIIVMIILAASVVITLSNSNIINRATEATKKTDTSQVMQLANLAWAEGYMENLRGTALNQYVQNAMKDYTNDYTIEVTDKGVNVTEGSSKKLNEYGFYYNIPYESVDVNGAFVLVFKEDGTVEGYENINETGLKYAYVDTLDATYDTNEIVDETGNIYTVTENGKKIIALERTFNRTDLEYNDVRYNTKYYYPNGLGYMIIEPNNKIVYYTSDGQIDFTIEAKDIEKKSHIFIDNYGDSITVSLDGMSVLDFGIPALMLPESGLINFKIYCEHSEFECQAEPGMTWAEWLESSYNTIGAKERNTGIDVTCGLESSYIKAVGDENNYVRLNSLVLPWKYVIHHGK